MEQDQRPISIVDIYGTVSRIPEGALPADAVPVLDEILKYNGLFLKEEATVVYITSRTDVKREDLKAQLDRWGCMYHRIQIAKEGHSSASTFHVDTPYGCRFGFDEHTYVYMFTKTESRPVSYLGPRYHTYKSNHMYILHGIFTYAYVDGNNGTVYIETVRPGSIVHTPAETWYSLELAPESDAGSILVRGTHAIVEDNHTL